MIVIVKEREVFIDESDLPLFLKYKWRIKKWGKNKKEYNDCSS